MTMHEKIKNMSVEEMAKFFDGIGFSVCYNLCREEPYPEKAFIEWLSNDDKQNEEQ